MGSPAEDLASQVKSSVEKKVGQKAVDGGKAKGGIDCFALVDQVLKSVGAKTAADFGDVTPTSDYVWGEAVKLESVQFGYVLQFRDHTIKTRTETLGEFKWEVTSEEGPHKRPHHTAVVVEVRKDGSVVVVEQNVKPNPKTITRNVIERLSPGEETRYRSNRVKVTITVTGTVKAYRPVPKPKGTTLFRQDEKPAGGGRRMLAYFIPGEGGPRRRPGPIGMG